MAAIEVRDDSGVRWITFARPDKHNALTVDELVEATRWLTGGRPSPSAVVFTGAGDRAFSAGMHLDSFHELDRERARTLITHVRDFLAAARSAPVPTVCAINGHCLGAAFELALACDIRIAAEHATFGLPEIKVGVPSVVDAALLSQHVGLSMAKEMILTGDLYSAAAMARHGMLNRVVPGDELLAETDRMLTRLAGHNPAVVAAQKRLFESWQNTTLGAGIDASLDEFAGLFGS
ncbi:MAG: enoyl-CoA hydratase [Pseudonocardiaceae bacterium]|nr:enoyl-CoA hydratase [Pseudonocardiaceae bacterium]